MESRSCLQLEAKVFEGFSPQVGFQPVKLDLHAHPVVVLAGPTATGKSDLALRLAALLGGEIVSADSMQVYRGMDIGTAKPSLDQQRAIVHHMIDVREVTDPMNVAQFCEEATGCIRSILARGRVPIVVGGSGFYVDALIRGAPSGPPADPFVRAHLASEMDRLGPESLYEQVQRFDPEYAASITHADRHKIMRALEIMILNQCKVSDLLRHSKREMREFRFLCYFLHRPRPILYDRINQRCQLMVQMGLFEEVKELLAHGLLDNPSAANAIGYRQTLDFLRSDSPATYEYFLNQFQQASRQYAKRQFTWFRKDELFEWIDLEAIDDESLFDRLASEYHQR